MRGWAGLWVIRAKHLAHQGVACAAHEARQVTKSGGRQGSRTRWPPTDTFLKSLLSNRLLKASASIVWLPDHFPSFKHHVPPARFTARFGLHMTPSLIPLQSSLNPS